MRLLNHHYGDMSLAELKTALILPAVNQEAIPFDAEVAIMAHGLDYETFIDDIAQEYLEKHQFSH